ncbi:MAG TPA: preprotein translocase subunit SecA, partial [bacterium (Candidatus Stahlbacteria)]|nr:preprotein translocase subunit SecA [Candidatus Stahlbacteria bacterium]
MLQNLLTKIFGSKYERELKKYWPLVDRINETYEGLRDKDLKKLTEELIKRLVDGEEEESVMIDALAGVKEACRRLVGKKWLVTGVEFEWNMVPFDVQLVGAIVLHQGKIAEMKTGEGKTLVATMPLYLNAIIGRARGLKGEENFLVEGEPRGVCHLVTVNDYLARRDREWMGPVYESMGLTVGVIQQGMNPEERKPEYNCDITYGTNNEFGFDYLRDNMVVRWEDKVQRGHYYAIIDEVDSILIDEARTPLIISGPVEHTTDQFGPLNRLVSRVASAQTILVNRLVEEAKKLLKSDKEYEAGVKLLQARRGYPKHKQLMRLEQDAKVKRLIEQVELNILREKKIHDIDEELYFIVDEKSNVCDLTEKGRNYLAPNNPEMFVLPDLSTELGRLADDPKLTPKEKLFEREKAFERYAKKSEELSNLRALLKAYTLFQRDIDYVVQDGRVIIVDQFTGRLMPGRRYSDGIHQALEAKEGVRVQEETQTFATITIQNYFRMYDKLAGMTGTAATEANEFWEIYRLDVSCIPTKEPVRRIDYE